MLQLFGEYIDFTAYTPEHPFDFGACLQIHHAMGEEVEGFLTNLLRIVPVLQHIAGIQVVPYFIEVLDQLMGSFRRFETLRHLRQGSRFQHVDNEYGMVSSQRASAFGDEVGVGKTIAVGSFHESIDTVVDVFLNAVVHGTLA